MGFEYTIDPEARLAYVQATSPSDYRDSFNTMIRVATAPSFEPEFNVLADVRDWGYAPSLGEAHDLSVNLALMQRYFRGRIAVVTPAGFRYLPVRFAALLARANNVRVEVFTSMPRALRWLTLP